MKECRVKRMADSLRIPPNQVLLINGQKMERKFFRNFDGDLESYLTEADAPSDLFQEFLGRLWV